MSYSTSLGIKPRPPSLRGPLMFYYKNIKQKSDMTLKCLPLSNLYCIFLLAVLVFKATEDRILKYSGANIHTLPY